MLDGRDHRPNAMPPGPLLALLPFLLMLSAPAHAQTGPAPPPPTLTLKQALALASKSNLDLRNAELDAEGGRDAVASARTRLLPVTSIDVIGSQLLNPVGFDFPRGAFGSFAGIGPVPADDTTVESPRAFQTYLSASVTQPLTQLYRAGLGVKLSLVGQEAGDEKLRERRQAVANEVKRLYYGLLQARGSLDASTRALELYGELSRVADQRVAQQTALPAEAMDARARLAAEQYHALALRNAIATGKERLNDIMGRDLTIDFEPETLPAPTAMEIDPDAARRRALDSRPEVRQAALGIRQAELDLKVARSAFIPDVSVGYGYLANTNVDVLPREISALRVLFQWEPLDWGRRRSDVAQKERLLEQSGNTLRDTQNKVLLDVNARHRALQEARLKVEAARLERDAAEEKARNAADHYRMETALMKDVLAAQAELAESARRHDDAVLALWTATADFERALGED